MLEVSKKKVVKTRKKHECYGCLEIIDKGEAAVHVRGKEDDQSVYFHLHINCHVVAIKQKLFAEGFTKGAVKQAKKENNDYSVDDTLCPFN